MRSQMVIQIILLILAIIIAVVVVKPKFSEISQLQDEQTLYEDALKRTGEYNRELQALVSRADSLSQSDLKKLNTYLPATIDITEVSRDIKNIAEETGLLLLDIGASDVSDVTVLNAQKAYKDTSDPNNATNIKSNLKSANFDVTVVGNYGQLKTFLHNLEINAYPLNVMSLDFNTKEQKGDLYTFDLSLETYSLNKEI